MFCSNCSKLSYQYTTKHCIKCKSYVYNTISVLCDTCSDNDLICSVCIKKINTIKNKLGGGCNVCGR
jgi:hypothetical protein